MADRVGQQLGNYRLTRLLGRGGFAEVYLGEHLRLSTQAAIKVLHTSLEDDDVEGFLREAKTVARLKHPHIVRVYDFDVENHIPFLVMDYLPNGNVRRSYPKGIPLPLETIVYYVTQVASALQYAHDEKLIHRDIKPENMLLDRDNTLVLSDFGIALMSQSSRYQSTQEVAGTAAYMAPEQFQGHPRRASDQYALGVVVYEWLTGDRPFHGSFTEIASQHLFVPPPPLRGKVPTISPDVEQVVMTALEKDPDKRFGSVKAFATALEQASQSAQSHSSILSWVPTTPDQPQQPARKASTLTPLPQQTIVPSQSREVWTPPASPYQPQQASSAPGTLDRLEPTHQGISRRTVVLGLGLAGLAVVGLVGSITWLARSQSSGTSLVSSSSRQTPPTTPLSHPTPHSPPIGTTLLTYHGHSSWMTTARWSPDDARIASGGADKTVQVWDAATGNTIYTYRGHADIVVSAEWSPNGTRIASSGNDTTVQVWDSATGSNILTYRGHSGTVYDVAWSPNGKHIVSAGSDDRTAQIWDALTGTHIFTYQGHSSGVLDVAWSPDGQYIASAGDVVQVWDAATGNTIYTYRGHSSYVRKVLWSPDGTRIASGSHDKTAHVWDALKGGNVVIYQGHSDSIDDMGWSSNRQLIASSGEDHTVQIWNPINVSTIFTYRGHSTIINALGWSHDGTRIVSGDNFASVQVWQAS